MIYCRPWKPKKKCNERTIKWKSSNYPLAEIGTEDVFFLNEQYQSPLLSISVTLISSGTIGESRTYKKN
jgi:hypothetical protein